MIIFYTMFTLAVRMIVPLIVVRKEEKFRENLDRDVSLSCVAKNEMCISITIQKMYGDGTRRKC